MMTTVLQGKWVKYENITIDYMKANGTWILTCPAARVYKFGPMDLVMTVSGKRESNMVSVVSFTLRAMSMKECGKRIKLMDMESTNIIMEIDMKVSGDKINNMVKE